MQPCKGHFYHHVVKGWHVLTLLHGAENNHADMCIVLCPSINFCYCSTQCQEMKERISCLTIKRYWIWSEHPLLFAGIAERSLQATKAHTFLMCAGQNRPWTTSFSVHI